MKRITALALGLALGMGFVIPAAAEEVGLFEGFEAASPWYAIRDAWKDGDRSMDARPSEEHATEGKKSLEASFDIPAGKAATFALDLPEAADWTFVKSVIVDFFVPGSPLKAALAIQTGDDYFW